MRILSIFLTLMVLVTGVSSCAVPIAEEPLQYSLTVSSSGGGSVIAPGEDTFDYEEGAVVDLVATADDGYHFVEWMGDVDTVASVKAATTTITMSGDYSIRANFADIPPARYSLTVSSTTGGSVIAPGEGTFTYDADTVVDLVAEAEDCYLFVNWTGDAGTISSTSAATTTITINGDYSVEASFRERTPLAATSWPKFQYDTANTGQSPHPSIVNPTIKWSYITDHYIRSSPVIGADGTVYVGSEDSRLYALNPDGTLKWSLATWGQINAGAPAIGADGTIYVGSIDYPGSWFARLYAINKDGTVKWEFTADRSGTYDAFSPSIGPDGTIYVGSDKLYAVNQDGTLKWSYDTGRLSVTPALAPDGTIYVISASDGQLYAISPDGTLKWSYQTASTETGGLWSSPSVGADGTVYFGTPGDNKLYAVNPSGSLKWTFPANHWIGDSPAIGSDGTIYIGEACGYCGAPEQGYSFCAINPDGTLKWSFESYSAVCSSASIASDGSVYFASFSRFYALNSDGSQKWVIQLGGSVHGSCPAIGVNGEIYIGAYDGRLYAIHGEVDHG